MEVDLMTSMILNNHNLDTDVESLKNFLRSQEHLIDRNVGSRLIGGGTSLSPQEYLYHKILNNEQKISIYESAYEIGSPLMIEDFDNNNFHDYLYKTYGGEDVIDLINKIKKNITDLIGIPFNIFHENNRNLALKVITLFYRVCRKNRSHVFEFLKGEQNKANFEFRVAYPHLHEQAKQNSALLSELLTHLTFSMPSEYLTEAKKIHPTIAEVAKAMAVYAVSEIKGENNHIPGYSRGNLDNAFEKVLNKDGIRPTEERLDFLLYASLILKEYEQRSYSNKLVTSIVFDAPLKLATLRGARIKSFSDKDVLSYLTGKDISRVKSSLEKQSDFVVEIIKHYNPHKVGDFPKMNKQIIKALILNDEKLNVEIPSNIMGVGNIPKSVTSILKKAEHYSRKNPNGEFPNLLCFPEALVVYWNIRYHYAQDLLMDIDPEKYLQEKSNEVAADLLVDSKLMEYLKQSNITTFKKLPLIPHEFMTSLGYKLGKVNYIIK